MPQKRKTDSEIVLSAAASTPSRKRTSTSKTARAKRTAEPAAIPGLSVETVTPQAEIGNTETAPVTASQQPNHQEIAELAYSFWLARGCQGGSPEEDWARAEEQLRTQTRTVSAAHA